MTDEGVQTLANRRPHGHRHGGHLAAGGGIWLLLLLMVQLTVLLVAHIAVILIILLLLLLNVTIALGQCCILPGAPLLSNLWARL